MTKSGFRSHLAFSAARNLARAAVLVAGLAAGGQAFAQATCTPDFYDGQRAYDGGNREAAIQIWSQSGLQGDVRSQYRLGEIFETGDTVLINYIEAHKWYNLAANNDLQRCSGDYGNRESRNLLELALEARARLEDIMTDRSISDAELAFVTIFECQADPRSLYQLGRFYQAGTGLRQSPIDACRYFAVAASRGVREAKDALFVLNEVLEPEQIDECQREAGKWQRPSLERCSPALVGDCTGAKRVPWQSRQIALRALGFYRGGIDGDPGSMTRAAVRDFQRSIGAKEDGTITEAQICLLIERAAAKGDAGSQAALGEMYFTGVGKSKNVQSAISWFERAADRGVPVALLRLGSIYVEGAPGVVKDFARGCDYLREADSLGHPHAERLLNKYCN